MMIPVDLPVDLPVCITQLSFDQEEERKGFFVIGTHIGKSETTRFIYITIECLVEGLCREKI
jgi:hypothetical protein